MLFEVADGGNVVAKSALPCMVILVMNLPGSILLTAQHHMPRYPSPNRVGVGERGFGLGGQILFSVIRPSYAYTTVVLL
jgi:hypothetical protein